MKNLYITLYEKVLTPIGMGIILSFLIITPYGVMTHNNLLSYGSIVIFFLVSFLSIILDGLYLKYTGKTPLVRKTNEITHEWLLSVGFYYKNEWKEFKYYSHPYIDGVFTLDMTKNILTLQIQNTFVNEAHPWKYKGQVNRYFELMTGEKRIHSTKK